MKHPDFSAFLVFVAISYGLSSLFVYCFFGKMATESYVQMADCLFDSKWFELPLQLQKYFIIMIKNAQRPMFFHCLGVIVLDLLTFTTVKKNHSRFTSQSITKE